MRTGTLLGGAAAALVIFLSDAGAEIIYNGVLTRPNQDSLEATATFALLDTNKLQVTLEATGGSSSVPADVLGGLFFNYNDSSVSFSPLTALLPPSTVVIQGTPPSNRNVGGEWAYLDLSSPYKGTYRRGAGSIGLGVFGNYNFPPPAANLYAKEALDGFNDLGIVHALANPNPKVQNIPLLTDRTRFTLQANHAVNLSKLGETVLFQYGTSQTEPHSTAQMVPEPAVAVRLLSLVAGLSMAGALGLFRRRKGGK